MVVNSEKEKVGFWLHIWMEHGRGHNQLDENYEFLKYDDGYVETDEKTLKCVAEDFCHYDKQGFNIDHYSYGFDVVVRPPASWLMNKLKNINKQRKSLIVEENLVMSELTCMATGNSLILEDGITVTEHCRFGQCKECKYGKDR